MNSYLNSYVQSPYSNNNDTGNKPNNVSRYSNYPKTLDEPASADSNANSNNVGSVQNINNWGLILAIFFLYPLFCIKVAESVFATKPCSQVDLSPFDAEQCEANNVNQQNFQYLIVLVLGCIGVIAAIILAKTQRTSRSAAFGLCYGSFATIIYAVCANYSRLTPLSQVSILALLLTAFIFLPHLTKSILLT